MDIAFDPRFIPSVNALAPVDVRRVWKAVETFQRDPDHSGLNFERMKGKAGRQRLHTIRASRPVRVLLAREGQTAVFLRAGPHEFIDNLVASVAFTVPDSGAPRLGSSAESVGRIEVLLKERCGGLRPVRGAAG